MIKTTALLTVLGLTAATQADILITEVMYDNAGGNEHEYIELYNNGVTTIDLTGYTISDDPAQDTPHTYTLTSGSIEPGGTAVLVRIDTARLIENYENAWGASINWIEVPTWPTYTNGGDVVVLTDPASNVVASVAYGAGVGFPASNDSASIYMLDVDAVNPYDASNWALSQDGVDGAHYGNSPRTADIGSPGVIPEPASLALMGLGAAAMIRRR